MIVGNIVLTKTIINKDLWKSIYNNDFYDAITNQVKEIIDSGQDFMDCKSYQRVFDLTKILNTMAKIINQNHLDIVNEINNFIEYEPKRK